MVTLQKVDRSSRFPPALPTRMATDSCYQQQNYVMYGKSSLYVAHRLHMGHFPVRYVGCRRVDQTDTLALHHRSLSLCPCPPISCISPFPYLSSSLYLSTYLSVCMSIPRYLSLSLSPPPPVSISIFSLLFGKEA